MITIGIYALPMNKTSKSWGKANNWTCEGSMAEVKHHEGQATNLVDQLLRPHLELPNNWLPTTKAQALTGSEADARMSLYILLLTTFFWHPPYRHTLEGNLSEHDETLFFITAAQIELRHK